MRKQKKALWVAGIAATSLLLTGCAGNNTNSKDGAGSEVTLRLWDENAAAVYEQIASDFEASHDGAKINIETVPWADYFSNLRQDIASGSGPDLFWLNGANVAAYAKAGQIADISSVINVADTVFDEGVVEQYSIDSKLYGIPQIADGRTALFYNEDLLAKAGLTVDDLQNLKWSPDSQEDTFLPVLKKLAVDSDGHTADDEAYDRNSIKQYAYNAALDLQAIQLPFIGSNGGTYQNAEELFTFTDEKTVAAYEYIVSLINEHGVAPAAADTNTNGDWSRDAFLRGEMAVFQSGTYNLANVAEGAAFNWGVTEIPAGPAGAVSASPGVIAAFNTQSADNDMAVEFANYLATPEVNTKFGEAGSFVPAVVAARDSFNDYWLQQGTDVSAFFAAGKTIPPVTGAKFQEAAQEFTPIMQEIFLGRTPVARGLSKAEQAANSIMQD